MTKRIICLFLAVLMFAALPGMAVFADKETQEYTVGAETMKDICAKQGLDYNFCKAAIIKLNDAFNSEADFSSIHVGDKIKLPKTNQDAAEILGVELPDSLKPPVTGETQTYTIKKGDTMIGICKALGLDYTKCKSAILKLNGWSDYNLLTLRAGDKIKLPKTDADAAVIAASGTGTTGTGTTGTGTTGTTGTGTILAPADGTVAAYMVPYVVKPGETIYGICLANGIDFNRYVNLIMQASGITYASSLHAGDIIYLPSSTASSGSMSIVTHVVKAGETVYGICQALGIDYSANLNLITSLNPGKNLSAIHTGDVLFFPKGAVNTATGTGTTGTGTGSTGTGSTGSTGSGAGYGGGYTPAAPSTPSTPEAVKPKEGVMYYLKEITIKTDDTVYNLIKAEGFDYINYYIDVMLTANNMTSFNYLKNGDKLLLVTKSAAGAKIAVTGIKVKEGDTVIKMCQDAGVNYNENVALIGKLNAGVNFNNLKTGDIVVLPKKA